MNPIVEFCVNNVVNGSEKVVQQLEADGRVDVVTYECLSECVTCARDLFAIVEGTLIKGENPEALLKNIYQELESEEWL